MKIEIENLKAQMAGRELNIYQKADALIEFNKLVDYVNELEQLAIPVVIKQSELLIAFAECKEYNGKWQTHEQKVKNFLKEYKSN